MSISKGPRRSWKKVESKSTAEDKPKAEENIVDWGEPKGRRYHFISGVTRAGSTLFCNILAQNPECFVTATSGILEPLLALRNNWDNNPAFKAMPHDESKVRKQNTLRGMFRGYFRDVEQPVVFDKSRGWPGYIEMAEMLLDDSVKIIITVRDLREVFASWEKLWRKTVIDRQPTQEQEDFFGAQTALGRIQIHAKGNGLVGLPVNRIKDAVTRGYRDSLLFVDYDDLCKRPQKEFDRVYEFLDMEPYEHDFKNVEQVTQEDDYVHIFPDLHDIRPEVKPQPHAYPVIFDDTVTQTPFWREISKKEERRFWDFLK